MAKVLHLGVGAKDRLSQGCGREGGARPHELSVVGYRSPRVRVIEHCADHFIGDGYFAALLVDQSRPMKIDLAIWRTLVVLVARFLIHIGFPAISS